VTAGQPTVAGAALRLRTVIVAVAISYIAVTVHNVWIKSLGGVGKVPLVLFGLCQLTPAVVALVLGGRAYLPRLGALFRTPVSWRLALVCYLLSAATLAACILVPYALGLVQQPYGPEVAQAYPLKRFVPSALLAPEAFWIFVVVGAPILHLLMATGEEVLWRGYLLDEMRKVFSGASLGVWNGVAWGLWHTPMVVLLGWDFPGHPVTGMIVTTLSQMAWSFVLVRLRLETDSLWPCIIMHAVANAMTIGLYDRLVDHSYNLFFSPWGMLGGTLMTIIYAVGLRSGAMNRLTSREAVRSGP
jgi:membrane protease YdiL (CAAX protease family)